MSATGRLVTRATSRAAAGAGFSVTGPVTWTPALRRKAANWSAALAAGSASRLSPPGAMPWSTQSAVIGETSLSVT